MEGIKDGSSFLSAIKKASESNLSSPEGGRTEAGSRAAVSHTGSLAGDFRVARAAFAQAGAIVAETTEDFLDYLFALAQNRHQLPDDEKLLL